MESVFSRPPDLSEFDACALGHAEVRALADHLAVQLGGVQAQRVVGAIAGVLVAFIARLDVGADAAEPEQLHLGPEHGGDKPMWGDPILAQIEQFLHFRRDWNRLGFAIEDAAALGDQAFVIVVPGRARQLEQAFAFCPALFRVGVGIDEDMQMVESADQLDVPGQQHAVAEHIARHVADADHREGLGLDILADLAEVALDRLPGTTGGDAMTLWS